MRNKFHKLLSMFLVMLIVINQFGNITVLAESLAEQPERSLTIEVDQEEAALGEQFQLRVRGTPDLLNALVIDKSEDLIEGEVKQLNDYERLITYSSQHSGKVADSSDIRGNNPTSSGNKHLPKTGETIISQFILSILGVLLVFISIKFRKKRNI